MLRVYAIARPHNTAKYTLTLFSVVLKIPTVHYKTANINDN